MCNIKLKGVIIYLFVITSTKYSLADQSIASAPTVNTMLGIKWINLRAYFLFHSSELSSCALIIYVKFWEKVILG